VWTEGPTVEINLHFKIPSNLVSDGHCLNAILALTRAFYRQKSDNLTNTFCFLRHVDLCIQKISTIFQLQLRNFSSAKERKQGEKVLASFSSPRLISFLSKEANLHFDAIFTVFVNTLQNGYLQIFKIVFSKDPGGGSFRRGFYQYLTVQGPTAKK